MQIRTDISTEEAAGYTVGSLLAERAREIPDHPVLVFPDTGKNQTYGELNEAADAVARSLISLFGDERPHVALWAPNVRDWITVECGAARAGMPLVLVNTNLGSYDLEYILSQSDTRLLFVTGPDEYPASLIPILENICPGLAVGKGSPVSCKKLPELEYIVYLRSDPLPGVMSRDEFLNRGEAVSDQELRRRADAVRPQDVFSIQYTSGTTGRQKGALLPHMTYTINGFATAHRQGLTADDIFCIPVPFFHVYGNVGVIAAIAAGGAVAPLERFNAALLLETIETCRATAVCGTPTMFIAALEELGRKKYDLLSLKGGSMAGSPCPPDLVRRVCTEMGADEFGVLYGFTEGIVMIMTEPDDTLVHRTETLGRALPDVQIRVIDPATGRDQKVGEHGEMIVKSPTLMLGYYQMPEKTAEAIDSEGWYHSGDMVRADQDGYYTITGRIKDMIIRGGENIFPAEVEAFLLSHPNILDAQVVGVPSDYYGEEPVAFVRLKPGASATPLELKQYCRKHISIEKVPSTFIVLDQYPLTALGKVKKFRLREMAQEMFS